METNDKTRAIIGAVIEVHRCLGPGLLEGVYEEALAREMEIRSIPFERQKQIPIRYKGYPLRSELRVDFLVYDEIVLELKSVEQVCGLHQSQFLTYLRLTGCRLGLLINSNVLKAVDGIQRLLNNR